MVMGGRSDRDRLARGIDAGGAGSGDNGREMLDKLRAQLAAIEEGAASARDLAIDGEAAKAGIENQNGRCVFQGLCPGWHDVMRW